MPVHGDDDKNATYAGIGRVVSEWELLESELSDLHAIFIGARYHEHAYYQYFKAGRTSQARIATVAKAAQRYFRRSPDQELEGDFCGLMRKVKGFSERRHEVARGIVRNIDWFSSALPNYVPDYSGDYQYCVVPPDYQREWYRIKKFGQSESCSY